MSADNFYTIERILERKKDKNRYLYKIKWEGYPMDQCTWEPIENLKYAIGLVEEFNNAHPIKDYKTKKTTNKKFLNKKRYEIVEKKAENANEQKQENNNIQNNNIEEKKPILSEYNKEILTIDIDTSLKKVVTVKKQDQTLMAVVNKIQENGEMVVAFLPTEDLRKRNPLILLDFYESKIKFS